MTRANQVKTDMGFTEAFGLVLELARMNEYPDLEGFQFEWENEHSEACGVCDEVLHALEVGAEVYINEGEEE
jgi:hypothetical protein